MEISSLLQFLLIAHLISSRAAGKGQKHLEVTQPEMVTAEAGQSATVTCSFTSESPSYFVTWSLGCNNTVKLQDQPCFQRRVKISTPDVVQTPQSVPSDQKKTTLTITNLTENDSGTFCCHITTAYGETGNGPGTRLEVTPRSLPEEDLQSADATINTINLVLDIIRIICLIILIVLLAIAVKTSC